MAKNYQTLRALVLGELDGVQRFVERGGKVGQRRLRPIWLASLEQLESFDLGECEVVITDSAALGLGVVDAVNTIKARAPHQAVVLVAGVDEVQTIVEAQQAGLDEYVLRIDDPGFDELLGQTLQRAIDRQRQDLPALLAAELSQSQFWAFFESVPIPMKVLDAEGSIVRVNEAASTFLGYRDEGLVGARIFDIIHVDEIPDARRAFQCLLERGSGEDHDQSEYRYSMITDRRYVRNDGGLVWANIYLLALWNADGSLRHVLGLMVDITHRKVALQVAMANERALLDTAVDGILMVDETGKIEIFNRACERIFGYAAQEVLDYDLNLLLPSKPREQVGWYLSRGLSAESIALEGQRKDGTRFPVEVSIGAIREGEGEGRKFTFVLRDVSERHHLFERLRRSERMEAVGQLAGGVSHDFNNVLTIINTYTYLLSEAARADHKDTVEYAEKILAASERGVRLTSQLMALSPNPLVEPHPLILNEVVVDLGQLFDSALEEDIELVTQLTPGLVAVRADLGQIEQILLNLILNARDAMPHGGKITVKTCNVTIDSAASRREHPPELAPGDYAVVQVQDSGQGIPDLIREHIFDPFFSTKEGGTGLGLATVYSIVERHHGAIGVKTAQGQGTTFIVYLPANDAQVPMPIRHTHQHIGPVRVNSPKTILLVEDEQDIRESLIGIFEQEGYEVLDAGDGLEALALARAHQGPIDMLLTDIVLPGLNGVELAEQVQEIYPEIATVFVSGYAGEALQRKRISPNQVHVSKPYDVRKLKDVVRAVFQR